MNQKGESSSLSTVYMLILLVVTMVIVLMLIARQGGYLKEIVNMLRIGGFT